MRAVLAVLAALLAVGTALSRPGLLPHGPARGDARLRPGDDESSPGVLLRRALRLYGRSARRLYVSPAWPCAPFLPFFPPGRSSYSLLRFLLSIISLCPSIFTPVQLSALRASLLPALSLSASLHPSVPPSLLPYGFSPLHLYPRPSLRSLSLAPSSPVSLCFPPSF